MKRLLVVFFAVSLIFTNIYVLPVSATTQDDSLSSEDSSLWPKGSNPQNISAKSAIIMDLSTGLILYEKNIHDVHYPASITKIMTTLLGLENSSLGETVTFSQNAIFGIEAGSSHIGIDVKEQLTVEQCVYGIMLESANEVSLGLAEHVSGTSEEFADMMNAKAKSLGCKNTHFVNPNGLHDDNHYTSAYDMALIAKAAMENNTFRQITSTKKYIIPPTNIQKETRYLRNHHQMLNPYNYPKYEYEYCIGGKTGYTTDSKWTLVSFAEKDGMELVCVVMNALGPTSEINEYTDTINLFNYCFENYATYSIGNKDESLETENPLFTKFNPFFDINNSPIQISNNASIVLPIDADFKDAVRSINFYSDISLKEGNNVIGDISYTYGGRNVGSSNIIYKMEDSPALVNSTPVDEIFVEEVTSNKTKKNLFPFIIGFAILFLLIIIIIYKHYTSRIRRKASYSYYRNRKNKY